MYNIKKRGRDFEQPDDENGLTDYYKLLHKHYTKWYEDYQYSPKMKINTDNSMLQNLRTGIKCTK